MSEWQPIETAPKHLFVLIACGDVVTVARFWPTEEGVHDGDPVWEDMGQRELDVTPTHWQCLPDPPNG